MTLIRDIFSTRRPIDRRIEKVIDYYADSEDRLAAEIEEYEATDNLEACFRKFLETYQAGVKSEQVTEIGMWVAGFYGSGKSSFTKYLGFALDPNRKVNGRLFLDYLCDRLRSSDVKALLRTTAQRYPTAVVLLDLGAEQLAESTAATVTNVLYWKILNLSGYSKEKKLAQLELTLEEKATYDAFQQAYRDDYSGTWKDIHNDPLLGVSRASKLVPQFMPGDFPEKDSFSKLRFEMAEDVRDVARRMINVVRKSAGCENILFLIDEAGQYVAPRSELILNLDGLARNFKELGKGKVWIVCTGQQTLTEIVERAAINSPELNRMRDRFPISIELDARDIREITYRRLLAKSIEGETQLKALYRSKGQATIQHTRLSGTSFYKSDPASSDFVRYYPFLPQHFEILMELIRVLARSTGGIGLRSAIRVMQDILVDIGHILPADAIRLADRQLGRLACADDFYITLRADINKTLPNVVAGVDKVERNFGKGLHLRIAQAIGALQPLENFPRTGENIAALLYPDVGGPANLEEVRQALSEIIANKDIGLVEDPQAGGFLFLSESIGPYRKKRTDYVPTTGEINRIRNEILKKLLEPQPSSRLENVKDIRAAVRMQTTLLLGDQEEIGFRLETPPAPLWEDRRKTLLTQTAQNREDEATIVWLFPQDDIAEDILPEVRKSEKIIGDIDERSADRDLAQYIRSERRLAERNRETVESRLREALLSGIFIFRGRPTPVRQIGDTLETAARSILSSVAEEVYHQYHLVKIRPDTDLAAKFLEVERLDRMPRDRDPLNLVVIQSGMPRIQVSHPALAETLRAFRSRVQDSGGGRLLGKAIQEIISPQLPTVGRRMQCATCLRPH
ncbi:MAG: BREX system P-loop protein BrxC [Anaerolineaceae bacterium]|nr:BREX system P-loop protein BrxC [Anaerolineaceae bacterium]